MCDSVFVDIFRVAHPSPRSKLGTCSSPQKETPTPSAVTSICPPPAPASTLLLSVSVGFPIPDMSCTRNQAGCGLLPPARSTRWNVLGGFPVGAWISNSFLVMTVTCVHGPRVQTHKHHPRADLPAGPPFPGELPGREPLMGWGRGAGEQELMKVPPAHSHAQTAAATLTKDKMALALGHRRRSRPSCPPTLEHPVQQRGRGGQYTGLSSPDPQLLRRQKSGLARGERGIAGESPRIKYDINPVKQTGPSCRKKYRDCPAGTRHTSLSASPVPGASVGHRPQPAL